MNTLPNGTILRVHGFVMLKGLDNGMYKIISQDSFSYTFARARGKKAICRHKISSIDGTLKCFLNGDLNGIEVLTN
jgi:hypothetical protein